MVKFSINVRTVFLVATGASSDPPQGYLQVNLDMQRFHGLFFFKAIILAIINAYARYCVFKEIWQACLLPA